MPEFQFAFKELADKLGAAVVGEPTTEEYSVTRQETTRGSMLYTAEGGAVFLAHRVIDPVLPPPQPGLVLPPQPEAWSEERILQAIAGQATRQGLPPRLPLACVIAESALNQYAERWGNMTTMAKEAIAERDRARLQTVLSTLKTAGLSDDISFGLAQLAWRFTPEPDDYGVENLLHIRALNFDPDYCLPLMGSRLRTALTKFCPPPKRATDEECLQALYYYNWPAGNGQPYSPAHEANYKRGLEEAKRILGAAQESGSKVLAFGRSQIGKRYAGPIVGEPDSYRWGNPGWDCSSFVTGCYKAANGSVPWQGAYTDNIWGYTKPAPNPAPGDMVFFEYDDEQAARFPHMGLYVAPGRLLDCAFSRGVTERAMPALGTIHYRRL